jgi:outer membrane protein TolC
MLIVLTLLGARAEEALTYETALREAVDHNPTLQRARLDRDASSVGIRSSQGFLDPVLSVDGNWRSSQNNGFFQGFPFESKSRSWGVGTELQQTIGTGTSYSLNVGMDRNFSSFVTDFGIGGSDERIQDTYTSNLSASLTQQILKGSRMAFNLQNITRARQDLERQELAVEQAVQDALAQTATAYWNWVYQVQLEAIAEEGVEVAAEALRVGRLQLEAGQIAPVEGTRLEAALVDAQTRAMDAAIAADQAADELALLIGREPGQERLPATMDVTPSPLELDPEAAVSVALAQNLDLLTARAEVDFAETNRINAKHGLLPDLSATASAGVSAQQESFSDAVTGLTEPEAFPFVQVAGRFSMPLGNRAARGDLARAGVQVSQRERTVAELEASVRAQVVQQVRVLSASQQRIALADANLALAEQTLAAEEALAEAGRTIQRNVLEARSEVTRLANEAAKARTDHNLARTRLLQLQGQLTIEAP